MFQNRLDASVLVPRPIDEVFAFFANAENLDLLTPPWVDFKIVTPLPITMRAGALIDYRIRIHRIQMRWRTEITVWDPPHRFVDTQVSGPYREWVHEHVFRAEGAGTRCDDRVVYAPRGWLLAPLVDRLFVRRDVERIFAFRTQKLRELFGASAP